MGKLRNRHFVFTLSHSLICFILFASSFSPLPFVASSFAEAKAGNNVIFHFVDVDIAEITKFVSDITGKNFIFDEKFKGKITIIAPSKLSPDDAYNLFTAVLQLKGFTVVSSSVNAFKIVPSSEAKQSGMHITTKGIPVNETYIARLMPLKYISFDDALKFFQPLMSKDGHLSAFGPGNMLLVVDSGLNIEKFLSILDVIDKPSVSETPEVVPLNNASAETVARILNEGLGKTKTKTVQGQPISSENSIAVADQRLNAIILFGDRGGRESMKMLIALIDVPSPPAQGRVNVFFLENADATELAKVLEGMIKGLQSSRQPAGTAGVPATPFESAGGITITADKDSNALVVVASPADYKNLTQTIKQLDRRKRQVYVEAMIIEASIDKLQSLGTKWKLSAKINGSPVAIGGFGTIDSTSYTDILQGLSGATLGGLGNYLSVPVTKTNSDGTVSTSSVTVPGFAYLFNLNDFKDAVKVLSTPQILTSDNKEAEILVGENVPFVSQSQTSTTSSTTSSGITNTIVRQDVGIILKITPQITEGDHVKLDIYQEISSLKSQSDNITISMGPSITKRFTKTSVVVKDNQTIVIGGLLQENDEDTVTKMPVLGDIPVLGWFFKTKSFTKNKTNLIVFLTPHVIKEPERLAEITRDKKKEFATVTNQYAPGELMVKFSEGVTRERALQIISEKGAIVIAVEDKLDIYYIRLKKGQSMEDALKIFTDLKEVRYAEPNYEIVYPGQAVTREKP